MIKIATPRYILRHLLEKRAQSMTEILKQFPTKNDSAIKPPDAEDMRVDPPKPQPTVIEPPTPADLSDGNKSVADQQGEAGYLEGDTGAQARADSDFGRQLYDQQN